MFRVGAEVGGANPVQIKSGMEKAFSTTRSQEPEPSRTKKAAAYIVGQIEDMAWALDTLRRWRAWRFTT